jgi:hypothetical protein
VGKDARDVQRSQRTDEAIAGMSAMTVKARGRNDITRDTRNGPSDCGRVVFLLQSV